MVAGLLLILSHKALSQTTAADNTAISEAISRYHHFLQPETGLYNGIEYIDYAYTIEDGSPFFMSSQFITSSVFYNDMLYQDVPLLYDIVKGEVVISDPLHLHKISLQSERILRFTILDYPFVRLKKDSTNQSLISTGFYQLLYSGKTRLYKKQTKTVQENLSANTGLTRYIDESTNYYLEKSHTFYTVSNKGALVNALQDKKKAVQRFIKKNKLRFKKDKDAALIKTAAFYDE